MHVNKHRRRNLLAFHWGQSEEDMKEARRETRRMQRQRSATRLLRPVHAAEEAFLSLRSFVQGRRAGRGGSGGAAAAEGDRDWGELSRSGSASGSALGTRPTAAPGARGMLTASA